jgi:hypothetical protein
MCGALAQNAVGLVSITEYSATVEIALGLIRYFYESVTRLSL